MSQDTNANMLRKISAEYAFCHVINVLRLGLRFSGKCEASRITEYMGQIQLHLKFDPCYLCDFNVIFYNRLFMLLHSGSDYAMMSHFRQINLNGWTSCFRTNTKNNDLYTVFKQIQLL